MSSSIDVDFMPRQFENKGLEEVPHLFMCAMFRGDFVRYENHCGGLDVSEPNRDVIEQRAQEYLDLKAPYVVIDIEKNNSPGSELWNLRAANDDDDVIVKGAVRRWNELLAIWRAVNPMTEVLIYHPIPRIYWELMRNKTAAIAEAERKAAIIAEIFLQNPNVAVYAEASLKTDLPHIFRQERQWTIKICREVYKAKCYIKVNPYYGNYNGWANTRVPLDQTTLLDVMRSIKEDGADGIAIWAAHRDLDAYVDYEHQMKLWSWRGGADGWATFKAILWMSAVERFLDEQNQVSADGDGGSRAAVGQCIASSVASCLDAYPMHNARWWLE